MSDIIRERLLIENIKIEYIIKVVLSAVEAQYIYIYIFIVAAGVLVFHSIGSRTSEGLPPPGVVLHPRPTFSWYPRYYTYSYVELTGQGLQVIAVWVFPF